MSKKQIRDTLRLMERQIPLAVVTRVLTIRVVRRLETKLRVVVVRMSPTTTTKILTMMTV